MVWRASVWAALSDGLRIDSGGRFHLYKNGRLGSRPFVITPGLAG